MPQATTRREFLAQAGAGAAVLPLVQGAPADATAKRRNIVLIVMDDMRFDALRCLGHPFAETPHMDALVKNGMLFANAFVTTSLCSPSRATMLTGLYAHTHGVRDNLTELPGHLDTFPRLLQQAGYKTAFIGKWHMGGGDQPRPGFDHWVSFKGQGVYENPNLNVDGESVQRDGYITDLLTEYACGFIDKNSAGPFCVCLWHKAVHASFVPAPRHKGCYANAAIQRPPSMADTPENYRGKPHWVRAQRKSWHGVDNMYNGTMTLEELQRQSAETLRAVDDSVGRVVAALRAKGLLDSTLILLSSDNGFQFGEHGLIDKRTMYEPSIRIPLVAHCPELVRAPRCEEMIVNADFAPTILDAAGVAPPKAMHGRSFLPLIRGDKIPWRESFLYEYFWERGFPQTPTVLGVRTRTAKFMRFHGIWDRHELYDLAQDPGEANNLLGEFEVHGDAGAVDQVIARKAKPPVADLYRSLNRELARLCGETGCLPEPTWQGAAQ